MFTSGLLCSVLWGIMLSKGQLSENIEKMGNDYYRKRPFSIKIPEMFIKYATEVIEK